MLFVGFLWLLTVAVCLSKSTKHFGTAEPIVNGQDAHQGKCPWKVLSKYKNYGESLLSAEHYEEWEPKSHSNFSMVFAVYDLSDDEREQELNVSEILMCPDNDSMTNGNDSGILTLQCPVPLNKTIQVVPAVYNESKDWNVNKGLCYSTSWGVWKQPAFTIHESHQALKTKVLRNWECNRLLTVNSYSYTPKMVCTLNKLSDVCFGNGSNIGSDFSVLDSRPKGSTWCVLQHDILFELPRH